MDEIDVCVNKIIKSIENYNKKMSSYATCNGWSGLILGSGLTLLFVNNWNGIVTTMIISIGFVGFALSSMTYRPDERDSYDIYKEIDSAIRSGKTKKLD